MENYAAAGRKIRIFFYKLCRWEKKMKILVTAGSTMSMIDKVRGITNIFRGKTGLHIAEEFSAITNIKRIELVTSNRESPKWCIERLPFDDAVYNVVRYRTYDNLFNILREKISSAHYDIIIHSAAINDYRVDQVMVKNEAGELTSLETNGKISSKNPEMFIRLVPTLKIVDQFRKWGFNGVLVKFKLEVGISDDELIRVATKSMFDSDADIMVANCLEWSSESAYIIKRNGSVEKICRQYLPSKIYESIREMKK